MILVLRPVIDRHVESCCKKNDGATNPLPIAKGSSEIIRKVLVRRAFLRITAICVFSTSLPYFKRYHFMVSTDYHGLWWTLKLAYVAGKYTIGS